MTGESCSRRKLLEEKVVRAESCITGESCYRRKLLEEKLVIRETC